MRAVAMRTLSSGAPVILEANFHRDRSTTWLRDLARIADTRVVLCGAPEALCRERFTARGAAGLRHPVHLDRVILEQEWPSAQEFEIDLGSPTLKVDTSDGSVPTLDAVVQFIRAGT